MTPPEPGPPTQPFWPNHDSQPTPRQRRPALDLAAQVLTFSTITGAVGFGIGALVAHITHNPDMISLFGGQFNKDALIGGGLGFGGGTIVTTAYLEHRKNRRG